MSTDWQACYQEKETPWDKGRPAPALEEIHRSHAGLFGGRVLVPGCGLGHDARWLAAQGCQVTGLDIAPAAVTKARELDAEGTVTFVLGDLFALPEELLGSFDMIWEHTCLCAMPPDLRSRCAASYKAALKPGGILVGVFYINPDLDPGETGPPFGISVEELEALWGSVGLQVIESWVPTVAYEGREGRERILILNQDPKTSQSQDQTSV